MDGKIRVFTGDFIKKVRVTLQGKKLYIFEDDPRYKEYLKSRKRQRKSFDDWLTHLKDYMLENGHDSFPDIITDASLNNFCRNMRYCYNEKQKGKKTERNFTDHMEIALNKIGFKWVVPLGRKK